VPKQAKILHPGVGQRTYDVNFAACGTASIASQIYGTLIGQTSRNASAGVAILQPSPSFWTVHFRITPVQVELYTLEIRELGSNKLLDISGDIDLSVAPPPPGAGANFGVSYPQPGMQLPAQFTAYGSSNQAGAIQGQLAVAPGSTCTQTTPPTPPVPWTMQVVVQNWDGNPATLTITQPGAAVPPPPVVIDNLSF
jgi:hypothetical protein